MVNVGLYGIDIIFFVYDYLFEIEWIKDGCCYIWIDNCVVYGVGDDGIIIYYSEYIFIFNCYFGNFCGIEYVEGSVNLNGIEIDDGFKYVWFLNNYMSGNICGIEVKVYSLWLVF